MFRSLRTRLILSHILPAIVIIPLMGVAMVYVLETRLLLPMIYRNLAQDATLLGEVTRNQPIFWQDYRASQALIDGVSTYVSGRISFVSLEGRIIASSDPAGSEPGAQVIDLPDLRNIGQGEVVQLQRGPLAEVFTPVYDLAGSSLGVIRMTTRVVTVADEIYQLRYLLGGVLAFGLLAGVGAGSYLALGINRPIQVVTRSIHTLADGEWQARIEEQGLDEIRNLAQAFNTLVGRLNILEQARRQLLANLVHELGRPIGAIHSASQALLKGADKDAQLARDLLTGIDEEAARLQRLLDDLVGLHDQVMGKLELNRKAVKLAEWLANTLSPWETLAREKGLGWLKEAPDDLPLMVMDPDRMAQALGNLLSNAIKFTPAGGQVSTTVALTRGELIVNVADTGIGVPADEQEKIFQPFYRGAQGRRIVQGMGLGLSITRDVVVAHGGDIEIQSKPGAGSRFTLRLPLEIVQGAPNLQ